MSANNVISHQLDGEQPSLEVESQTNNDLVTTRTKIQAENEM